VNDQTADDDQEEDEGQQKWAEETASKGNRNSSEGNNDYSACNAESAVAKAALGTEA